MQWEGDEDYYLCVVYNGETQGTQVVECQADGATYDFDPADGGWRWPEEPPPKKQRIYEEDLDDEYKDDGANDDEEDEEDEEEEDEEDDDIVDE